MKRASGAIVLMVVVSCWASSGWGAVSLWNSGGETSNAGSNLTARVGGAVDSRTFLSPSPFGPWVSNPQVLLIRQEGFASASGRHDDYQATTSVIRGKGVSAGSGSGNGSSFIGDTGTRTFFNIQGCHHLQLISQIGSSAVHVGYGYVRLVEVVPDTLITSDLLWHNVNGGEGPSTQQLSGMFSDGRYFLDSVSYLGPITQLGTFVAPDYDFTLTFSPCAVALISDQPQGGTILAGSAASLHVEVAGAGPFTYQWRRGNQNLVDGGDVSGATSPTLTIQNFESSDEGPYAVTVSRGVDTQHSSLAVLELAPAAVPSLGVIARMIAIAAVLSIGCLALRSGLAPRHLEG